MKKGDKNNSDKREKVIKEYERESKKIDENFNKAYEKAMNLLFCL